MASSVSSSRRSSWIWGVEASGVYQQPSTSRACERYVKVIVTHVRSSPQCDLLKKNAASHARVQWRDTERCDDLHCCDRATDVPVVHIRFSFFLFASY
jgi:hypothetical protein